MNVTTVVLIWLALQLPFAIFMGRFIAGPKR